ncbi:hypothetical protein BU17DRAFT_62078 [Hysterangium stoloniferum]|nr:hypothetical protein BU17DRAFT_62078 [Hysterangium stoloniferum]
MLAQIIPGKKNPKQIPLPTLKDPFNVDDDANEVIDKILLNIKDYYDCHSTVIDPNLQDHHFVDIDVMKLGDKYVKKGELTLQLWMHEDVPTASHISEDELNTIDGMIHNKKSVQAYSMAVEVLEQSTR